MCMCVSVWVCAMCTGTCEGKKRASQPEVVVSHQHSTESWTRVPRRVLSSHCLLGYFHSLQHSLKVRYYYHPFYKRRNLDKCRWLAASRSVTGWHEGWAVNLYHQCRSSHRIYLTNYFHLASLRLGFLVCKIRFYIPVSKIKWKTELKNHLLVGFIGLFPVSWEGIC